GSRWPHHGGTDPGRAVLRGRHAPRRVPGAVEGRAHRTLAGRAAFPVSASAADDEECAAHPELAGGAETLDSPKKPGFGETRWETSECDPRIRSLLLSCAARLFPVPVSPRTMSRRA